LEIIPQFGIGIVNLENMVSNRVQKDRSKVDFVWLLDALVNFNGDRMDVRSALFRTYFEVENLLEDVFGANQDIKSSWLLPDIVFVVVPVGVEVIFVFHQRNVADKTIRAG
jgi:hypothetical protein